MSNHATYNCADCGAPVRVRKANAELSATAKPLYCNVCLKFRGLKKRSSLDSIRKAIKQTTTEHGAPPMRIAMHFETLEMVKQEVNRTKEYILKMMPGGRQMKCLDLLVVIDNDLAIGDIRLER
jgi:DNA-directed RNA polymerase subunit RPC12/RpoP